MWAEHSASSRGGSIKDSNPCTHRQRKRCRGTGVMNLRANGIKRSVWHVSQPQDGPEWVILCRFLDL